MYTSKELPTEDPELATVPSQSGEIDDAVFGTAHEDGPDYKSVGILGKTRDCVRRADFDPRLAG